MSLLKESLGVPKPMTYGGTLLMTDL